MQGGHDNDKPQGQVQAELRAIATALGLHSGIRLDFICFFVYLVLMHLFIQQL